MPQATVVSHNRHVADALADIRKFIELDEARGESGLDRSRLLRNLRRQTLSRARSVVATAMRAGESLPAIEPATASKKESVDHIKLVEIVLAWVDLRMQPLAEDIEIDDGLVMWFSHPFLPSHAPHMCEKTLAALMHREPR